MKALLFLITVFTLNTRIAACQEKAFELNGTINIDTDSMKLIMNGDSSLYPKSVRNLTSPIINGKFKFKSNLPYPLAYRLLAKNNGYMSDVIVLEPGIQSVICNTDSTRKMPKVNNKVMQEYVRYREKTKKFINKQNAFDNEYKVLIARYPEGIPDTLKLKMERETQAQNDESDKNLLAFIRENPRSYWALWRFIH